MRGSVATGRAALMMAGRRNRTEGEQDMDPIERMYREAFQEPEGGQDRPAGYFEVPEAPDDYRHPSGVLVKFGEGLDDEGCHHWRSLMNIAKAELNVVLTRRTPEGPVRIEACVRGADMRTQTIDVRGFHDDDWTDMLPEQVSVKLSDLISIEVL